MSEISEAQPPPELVEQSVETSPAQADFVPVSDSPQVLPALPDAPPEFDDTAAEVPENGGQEQVGEAPSETADAVGDPGADDPEESSGDAPPEFDDTAAEVPENGGQEQVGEAPSETGDAVGDSGADDAQESSGDAPPEFDDTAAEVPENGGQEQVGEAPSETGDAVGDSGADDAQESSGDAPPEFDDTAAEVPENGGQEQVGEAPSETGDAVGDSGADDAQESSGDAPPEFDDTAAEVPENGGQEQVGEAPSETGDAVGDSGADDAQESSGDAPPEFDDTAAEVPENGGQEQVGEVPSETGDAVGDSGADDPQESSGDAPPEFATEAPEDGAQQQDGESGEAENYQTTFEDDQTKAGGDEPGKASAESEAEAQAAIDTAKNLPEDQREEPAQRDVDSTDDDTAGDRFREHDKQPPAADSHGYIARTGSNGEPPSYENELMDLEVAESRELCQRIADSYKDYEKSDLERREDGTLVFKDYQVEVTLQGDAFGSYKNLQRWISDHGMVGSRKDSCPYLEAHHLIPAAECREAGLDPELAPCIAVQNDLHIAMLHGSAGLTNRPEFSSFERMRAYYEGFYDGLNAVAWANRAGDYLESHQGAFAAKFSERPVDSLPTASTKAEIGERKAALSGVGDGGGENSVAEHSASARLDSSWKEMWSDHPSEEVRSRFEIAYNFYKESGVSENRILSHLKGIDFHNEVKVLEGKAGDIVYSHVKDGRIGNYFSKGDTKETLGIQPAAEFIGPERSDPRSI